MGIFDFLNKLGTQDEVFDLYDPRIDSDRNADHSDSTLDASDWRDINGLQGYQVNDKGEVRSVDRYIDVCAHKRFQKGCLKLSSKGSVSIYQNGKVSHIGVKKAHRMYAGESFRDLKKVNKVYTLNIKGKPAEVTAFINEINKDDEIRKVISGLTVSYT